MGLGVDNADVQKIWRCSDWARLLTKGQRQK